MVVAGTNRARIGRVVSLESENYGRIREKEENAVVVAGTNRARIGRVVSIKSENYGCIREKEENAVVVAGTNRARIGRIVSIELENYGRNRILRRRKWNRKNSQNMQFSQADIVTLKEMNTK